jgi:hypothetical protein
MNEGDFMRPTLNMYLNKKYNGETKELKRLNIMLSKSFGAPNFKWFWFYWNPVYSYYLMYDVYKPLKKLLPKSIALLFTFIVSGAFHDLMVLLILRKLTFKITFLFIVYAIFLIIENKFNIRVTGKLKRFIYILSLLLLPALLIFIL